jgi:hypothetical protein
MQSQLLAAHMCTTTFSNLISGQTFKETTVNGLSFKQQFLNGPDPKINGTAGPGDQ